MTTLFGIKNCDTVKKARRWLDQNNVHYRFHDFREDGLDGGQLAAWLEAVGYETLVNRRSTTWKQLPQPERDNLSADTAKQLLLEYPTLIKRPVLSHGRSLLVGFRENEYKALF